SASGYKDALDRYVVRDRLGDIIWAHSGMIFNKNVREQAEELKRRGLYLFDLWGFVPGSGPGAWTQFKRPAGVTEMFEEVLGDHWLGMDNGEQDGRYVGGYANQMEPFGADRFQQYMNFQRHFERMDCLLGNKMATLVSLNFGHYFMRECCYTLIGAETAQALPNAQIYYSFIRGAGKQYGVPWFGNVSVFNRWGWKAYPKEYDSDPLKKGPGPDKGTSLALMKKLMYEQIFYNSVAVGFESSCYWNGDQLSPVGRIQQGAVDWSARHGDPGVMHVPVAVMVDFYSGWSFPRHLYSGQVYKVWGALPYEAGDYLTDGVLDMLYPGYQDASYFRDERGFNVDTPYGDIADCLLSDAPAWLLRQYAVLVLAGRLTPSEELRDTLRGYVSQGGWLVMTRGNAESLFPKGLPAGRVTVIPSPWGVADTPQCPLPVRSDVGKPLDKPYPLLPETRRILDGVFRAQRIFATSSEPKANGLSLVTCRRGKGDYTVCVMNNTWEPRPFALVACAGRITAKEELPTDVSERGQIGFAPNTVSNVVVGTDTDGTIAAGAVRIFRVKTDEGTAVAEIPYRAPTPNAPRQTLFLRNFGGPIKEAVMRRPTFFRHYDSVMLDARYLVSRDRADLVRQTDWLKKQGLKVMVDASSLFNLFPDLRLVENDTNETARTSAAVGDLLDKMDALGAHDLVIALHRRPENNITDKEWLEQMEGVVRRLCRQAAKKDITVYLRQSPNRRAGTLASLSHWVRERVKEPNFKSAPSLAAQMLNEGGDVQKIAKSIELFDAGLWFVAAPARDVHGQLWSLHRPLAEQEILPAIEPLVDALKKKEVRLVYDAIYSDADAEYRDARLFERTGD
ncbi:MAG: hypothetical protein J6V72_20240, partial [Kiritimatiellae bacterium]|nr:hypothetical protein [Kiritimatiellia bacterium]